MAQAISDRAVDLGVFALDYEIEDIWEGWDPIHQAPLKESARVSSRRASSERMKSTSQKDLNAVYPCR